MTSFRRLAEVCERIEGISSSLAMTDEVASFLTELDEDELGVCPLMLMGRVFPEWMSLELGVGKSLLYSALSSASGLSSTQLDEVLREVGDVGITAERALASRAQHTLLSSLGMEESLSVLEVYDTLKKVAHATGKGSQSQKVRYLAYLFSSCTALEARYLARLVMGEMRIGVGEGIMRDAIALAFDVSSELVERAYMFTTDLGEVAMIAKRDGDEGLKGVSIQLFRPVKVMLAQITPSISAAMGEMGEAAVEWKYDGARVQIHKHGKQIRLFSRRLEEVTKPLGDVVRALEQHIRAETCVLDGEVVAYDPSGRPRAFQYILRRFRRKYRIEKKSMEIPLHVFLFDCLVLDDALLIDEPLTERRRALERAVEEGDIVSIAQQVITSSENDASAVYTSALDAGHEGIMLKKPTSPYTPGRRGKHWLKVKPLMETLDLVVVGATWGEGKRAHFLSSYTLACMDAETGELLEVGRVATGTTEEQLAEITEMLKPLIIVQEGTYVRLEPEKVFEVAYEEIQKSPNYPSGFALRFPRFVRVREDKSPSEADTLQRIAELYARYSSG
ncbi:MAG: ATP-dependent DNA ligase [Methermicoccaceae archaeon]